MNSPAPRLRHAPIVEAVLDVDCDLPPAFDLAALEGPSRERYQDRYPVFRTQLLHEHPIETEGDAPPKLSVRRAVQAFRFMHEDEKQLVQLRAQGFSFNRLAPYSSLDEYLPEIERAWRLYVELVSPVQIRVVRLRYINRILVPLEAGKVDLDEFLKIGLRLPDEDSLVLTNFLVQASTAEKDTGHQVNMVLTSQAPENDKLPIILDIAVASPAPAEPGDWARLRATVEALRILKNRIFLNTLTTKCIALFQ